MLSGEVTRPVYGLSFWGGFFNSVVLKVPKGKRECGDTLVATPEVGLPIQDVSPRRRGSIRLKLQASEKAAGHLFSLFVQFFC